MIDYRKCNECYEKYCFCEKIDLNENKLEKFANGYLINHELNY